MTDHVPSLSFFRGESLDNVDSNILLWQLMQSVMRHGVQECARRDMTSLPYDIGQLSVAYNTLCISFRLSVEDQLHIHEIRTNEVPVLKTHHICILRLKSIVENMCV